jgi:ornithine cyclodeaminase/alanine dehydrogenase
VTGLLHLSARDIDALALSPRDALDALEAVLRDPAVFTVPKVPLPIGAGHFFQAMPVASRALGLAAVKWVAVAAANPARGLPAVQAQILLNDLDSGRPVAALAGDQLTALRTAAMTACAARRLARADSASVAFIGCGVQARAHLAALRDVLPGLRRAAIVGRGATSTAAFRDHVAAAGLDAAIANSREAVSGADVVVSTVIAGTDLRPFLDGAWLPPGAFAALVDRGAPWLPGTLDALDLVATDDRTQSQGLAAEGKLAHRGPWAADLADLARADAALRRDPRQRTAFVFAGLALADLAVAALAYARARERGIGTRLGA